MYGKLLALTFEEARGEFAGTISNCNSARLLITFNGHNADLDTFSRDSDVIILYDMVDRKPLMLIERVRKGSIGMAEVIERELNQDYTCNLSTSDDGVYQDITIIRRAAYETLTSEC